MIDKGKIFLERILIIRGQNRVSVSDLFNLYLVGGMRSWPARKWTTLYRGGWRKEIR